MIHATALVDANAELAENVHIGAYTVIEAGVQIDAGTRIGPHVVIKGPTQIGKDNKIYQFASIGDDPQDKKYKGEPTRLQIGNGNTIREYVTINRGTVQDKGETRIGNNNWIMAYVHIAHDCTIGDETILANGTTLGGHVDIGDYAITGGFTLVHQFCRIGAHSFCAKGTGLTMDVPPYVMVAGADAKPFGLNSEGLKRRGFSGEQIQHLKKAYKLLYRSGLNLKQAVEQINRLDTACEHLKILSEFVQSSDRGIVR